MFHFKAHEFVSLIETSYILNFSPKGVCWLVCVCVQVDAGSVRG